MALYRLLKIKVVSDFFIKYKPLIPGTLYILRIYTPSRKHWS